MNVGSYSFATTSHTIVGSLQSPTLAYRPAETPDNLCFFAGFLWYVPPRTDDLVKVQLNNAGVIISQTKAADLTGNSLRFDLIGDLALASNGWLYFSAVNAEGLRFCRYRLPTLNSFEVVSGPIAPTMSSTGQPQFSEQWLDALAFRPATPTGARPLYGAYASAPSSLRVVATASGASTYDKLSAPSVRIIDFSDYHPGGMGAPVFIDKPALAFTNVLPGYTYADVGGTFLPGVLPPPPSATPPSIILANPMEIAASQQRSDFFTVKWTYDGQDPRTAVNPGSTEGPAFANGMPPMPVAIDISKWQSGGAGPVVAAPPEAGSYAIAVRTYSTTQNATQAIGAPDGNVARVNASGGLLVLDMGVTVAQGSTVNLRLSEFHLKGSSTASADVDAGTNGTSFAGLATFAPSNSLADFAYTVPSGGARYLRIRARAISGKASDQDLDVDAVSFGRPAAIPIEGGGGTLAMLNLTAVAKALRTEMFMDSELVRVDLSIIKTSLRDPQLSEATDASGRRSVVITPAIDAGDCPPGCRIYYTTDGTDPGVATDANGLDNPVAGLPYSGPIVVPLSGITNFVVTARVYPPSNLAAWFSASVTDYIDVPLGLAGGHMDVDTSHLLYAFRKGTTDGHVHQYDKKFNVVGESFFNFKTATLKNIPLYVPNGQKFKVIVANADLSPGGRLVINKVYNSLDRTTYIPVKNYDDTALSALPIYSLDGIPGTTRLTELGLYFDTNVIGTGGLLGTVTGAVRSNTPGRYGEWRNGAVTVQLVKVNPDGTDGFRTSTAISAGGVQGVATSGLLWETTFFWHHRAAAYGL
jgi:hypothetical protein